MKIILPEQDNHEIRGDLVPFIVQRTDLLAMPSTVEFLIRLNKDLAPFFEQGNVIAVGKQAVKYRIIFTMKKADGVMFQGDPNFTLYKVIAVLNICHKLTFLAEKAIIKENSSMGSLFRACGATINVLSDVAVDKFTCLIGEYPTYSLMRASARTATLPVWNGENGIAFTRVRDLFDKNPVEILHQDTTQAIQSSFLERHETPAFFSNLANGGIAQGQTFQGRKAGYEMFADKQILNNLSTYLVNCKIWTTPLSPSILAGDVIEIEKQKYIVITATHALGKAGSGTGSQMSRFWLGRLSDVVNKQK